MGWEKHQAVYVGHNDTEHRHLHIILNRVDHETGRTLDDYKERKRSQVWALAYEKQHETIRCEERELRAAKREGRTPDLEPTRQSPEKDASKEATASPAPLQPANDHLPHNVIMLARPEELAFKAHEMAREEFDKNLRGQLKAEQRAEREAFFKDGAKQFKATRHAVYDEVRKEYAPEWKQFYKDADAARHSAEAWSHSAVSRAMYFGKDGRWDEARSAFDDRDAVREVVAKEFSERKGDLKSRQNDDLRERQRDACDVLRDARDAEYQDLLQRQRDERAAFNTGQTLDKLGHGHEPTQPGATGEREQTAVVANENRATETAHLQGKASIEAVALDTSGQRQPETALATEVPAAVRVDPAGITAPEPGNVVMPMLEAPEVTRQVSDLAAGAIGSAASYLADQLGELFAPTPPEVREAQAKAAAKHEAEKPAPEEKTNPYARQIDAAMRIIEAEREQQKDRTYFEERDRDKGWERDQ